MSQRRKEPYDLVLVRFGIERLLYRLSRSRHADKFLLKGAMLFAIWSDGTHRPTRDVDLLGFTAPQLRAYPIYTVVAEKLEASVRLGEANTRMKDFFDLWFLSRKFPFDGNLLRDAIARTFARRESEIPKTMPSSFAPDFAERKATIWAVFVRRNGLGELDMKTALEALRAFGWPALEAARDQTAFALRWIPDQGWQSAD